MGGRGLTNKDKWLTEEHTSGYHVSWRVLRTFHKETTPYQELEIVELADFGKALILDNVVQTTVRDEFFYHEMIAHVPLCTHANPRQVLVIGGGDGGTVKEILKHKCVEKIVLVEIDGAVVEASCRFLPEISFALNDPRVEVIIDDGIKYINKVQHEFDVIIIDSSDPVGPAENLFGRDFYANVGQALKNDGLMVAQTESPTFNAELLHTVNSHLHGLFPIVKTYLSVVPTYIGGFWTFTLASKQYNPLTPSRSFLDFETRYYTTEIHQAAFVLPKFVEEIIR